MQESLKKIKSLKNLALDPIICYSNIGRNRLPNTRKVSDRMIALGSDHGGYKLKEEIKRYLEEKEIEYTDCGTFNEESVDYPDIAKTVALEIQDKECDKGILVCRSGIGMSIVANKFRGIRCAKCNDEEEAKYSRMHNDANILALGADYIDTSKAIKIVRMWIATEFEGGRHQERIQIIDEIEKENMK